MKIHYNLFHKLCSSDKYIDLSVNLSSLDLIKELLKELPLIGGHTIREDIATMIVDHWKDYLKNGDKFSFDERYRKPLEHFGRIISIKVNIIGHKRKYIHCNVLDPLYKKRANLIRILKTTKTSYLKEDEEYTLDLAEIKSGAVHEYNIFELACHIQINKIEGTL
jgi:hypothetical protein